MADDVEQFGRDLQALKIEMAARRSAIEDKQDPSALTVARIDHEIGNLREILTARDGVAEARLSAMDKAVELLQQFPTEIDIKVGNLKELHQEKFEGVGVRFNELNTRLTEGDRYKQTALDAALKAAQTLVDKQQENNKESIKKTEDLFAKQLEALAGTVDDLKDIIKEGIGRDSGAKERSSTSTALIFGVAATIYAIVASFGIVYEIVNKH